MMVETTKTDETVTVIVAGRRMLFETALRGMDADLFDTARASASTPQGIVDRYAELHLERHGRDWAGYSEW